MSQATLLERLRSSEILAADKLDDLARLPEAQEADPRALAKVLLKRGWLTRFQINQVASGRGKELLVGSYLLLDRLGEGGMGQVFKAQHRHMGRTVALKLMRPEKLGSPQAVARFYQEVQAAARLTHPNIVIAFDAGQVGNTHYFSMEYIDGVDLLRLVRQRGALPLSQACDFIQQAALGLQHAHEQGLVHRDIKPSNLLVTRDSSATVKILDMGLARVGSAIENSRNLTQVGQVLGTPDYLAPEQALDARSVDIRADIYSLGCTLFFLLTGRTPFQAEALAELLLKHQLEPPPLLRSELADAPAQLEKLLAEMMAKSPDDRPGTPAKVATALEPFTRDKASAIPEPPVPPSPVSAEAWSSLTETDGAVIAVSPIRAGVDHSCATLSVPAPPVHRRRKPAKKNHRHVLIGVGIGAGALVLVLAMAGAIFWSRPAKKSSEETAKAKLAARENVAEPPAAPKDNQQQQPQQNDPQVPLAADSLFDALESAAQKETWRKTPLRGGGIQEFYDIPRPGALLTGFEVGVGQWLGWDTIQSVQALFQFRKGPGRGRLWGKKQPNVVTLAAKPGYAVGKVTVRAGLFIDAIQVTFMAIDGQKLNPADSYQSEWIGGKGGSMRSLGGDGTPIMGIYGKTNPREETLTALGLIIPAALMNRPQRPGRAEGAPPPGNMPNMGLPPGVEVFTIQTPHTGFWNVGFTPDGKNAVTMIKGEIMYYDISTGKVTRTVDGLSSSLSHVVVSSDRKRALTSGFDRVFRLWDVEAGKPLAEFPRVHKSRPTALAFSPDGKFALSAGAMLKREGGDAAGKQEYADGEIRLWDVKQARLIHEFPGRTSPGTIDLAFTDDGKYIVASTFAIPLHVWDFTTRKLAHTVRQSREFLPAGASLAPAGGSRVLLGTHKGMVFVYDCADGREIGRFPEKPGRAMSRIVTSADRRLALVLNQGRYPPAPGMPVPEGHLIVVLDVVKGIELTELLIPFLPMAGAISPDGNYALLGSGKQLTCIDLRKLKTADGKPVVGAD
jgi:serine/threonine protein kinase/WD40 repeat protein